MEVLLEGHGDSMRQWIKFKGIDSRTFGIEVDEREIPVLPSAKTTFVNKTNGDGIWDFTGVNKAGRILYNNMRFTISMCIHEDNTIKSTQKLKEVAQWLAGKGQLTIASQPNTIWNAAMYSQISSITQAEGRIIIITVQFDVEPFPISE